jgi:hypothetical protein
MFVKDHYYLDNKIKTDTSNRFDINHSWKFQEINGLRGI